MNVHADHVLADGRSIGASSGTVYSYFHRHVMSMGVLDVADTEIGREVVVRWGDHGGRIKDVRATVAQFPYLTENRNDAVDTSGLASAR
jgi:vanillate/3-O-methylgallate O-demethylase